MNRPKTGLALRLEGSGARAAGMGKGVGWRGCHPGARKHPEGNVQPAHTCLSSQPRALPSSSTPSLHMRTRPKV